MCYARLISFEIRLIICPFKINVLSVFKYFKDLDPVYRVPDPEGHDIKLNTFKTSVALKFMIILQNLTTPSHKRSGESKYDRNLT